MFKETIKMLIKGASKITESFIEYNEPKSRLVVRIPFADETLVYVLLFSDNTETCQDVIDTLKKYDVEIGCLKYDPIRQQYDFISNEEMSNLTGLNL